MCIRDSLWTNPNKEAVEGQTFLNQVQNFAYLASPLAFTPIKNTRPKTNRITMGDTPNRELSVMVVAIVINNGAKNAVARPDRP